MTTAYSMFIGLLLGIVMSQAGFSQWEMVQSAFNFSNLHLLWVFVAAAVSLAIGWRVVLLFQKDPDWPPRKFHKGTIPGGIIFGIGWVLCGACPVIAFVQLGEGKLGALLTIAGIFIGNAVYGFAHARYFRWDLKTCIDD